MKKSYAVSQHSNIQSSKFQAKGIDMKRFLLGMFLVTFSLNTYAFNWPWAEKTEEVYNSVSETLAARGNDENKMVTYHIRDITKREISKGYTPREESLSSDTLAYLQDTLGGLKAEAQIYSDVYLGFDNKNFGKENLSIEGKIITVMLPKIEIIATDIDFGDTVLITKEAGVLTSNKERDELVNNLYNDHKKEMMGNILKGEKNLHEAKANAKNIIKEIIIGKFGADYTVKFAD